MAKNKLGWIKPLAILLVLILLACIAAVLFFGTPLVKEGAAPFWSGLIVPNREIIALAIFGVVSLWLAFKKWRLVVKIPAFFVLFAIISRIHGGDAMKMLEEPAYQIVSIAFVVGLLVSLTIKKIKKERAKNRQEEDNDDFTEKDCKTVLKKAADGAELNDRERKILAFALSEKKPEALVFSDKECDAVLDKALKGDELTVKERKILSFALGKMFSSIEEMEKIANEVGGCSTNTVEEFTSSDAAKVIAVLLLIFVVGGAIGYFIGHRIGKKSKTAEIISMVEAKKETAPVTMVNKEAASAINVDISNRNLIVSSDCFSKDYELKSEELISLKGYTTASYWAAKDLKIIRVPKKIHVTKTNGMINISFRIGNMSPYDPSWSAIYRANDAVIFTPDGVINIPSETLITVGGDYHGNDVSITIKKPEYGGRK